MNLAVRQVFGGAVDAGEVMDLFAVAGLGDARLDILSDAFLGRVAQMEQKNLALEALRKLLADQIRASQDRSLVQARKFREALEEAMLRYTNKQISTAEMIARLIEIAHLVREVRQRGEDSRLARGEMALYDALAENGSPTTALPDLPSASLAPRCSTAAPAAASTSPRQAPSPLPALRSSTRSQRMASLPRRRSAARLFAVQQFPASPATHRLGEPRHAA